MKKLSVVGLVLILSLLLAACGGGKEDAKNKEYKVGVDTTYPPFEFEENGKQKGIDIDLITEIAKKEGFKIKLEPMDFKGIIPALQANELDIAIAGMSITEERKKVVDFSDPYFKAGLTLVVAKNNNNITTPDDLKGKTIAVKKGTTGAKFAEDLAKKKNAKVVQFNDSPSMFQEVANGNADVLIEDYPVVAYAIAQKDLGLKIVGDRLNGDQYGIAVLKGENEEVLKKINKGLKDLKKSGKYDEIVKKYLKE
ncbi:transporter substrate-binding domain-containing protein [Fictibacillus terranigra]|uniref:Transporter substrate-binding domain-containing protein n=1 Tax=Fictibacillus terranigra TaxID=3058424 RepID=A0ABT8E879_9BACL|nr:transporter substrate-binding domain-containing protein [Fictibacillus sp. CENA-BCM004]MDN4074099.1 transporter substrate-binding domain-containing protein [Fictibacillus sp. CENA-BCM004]